MNYKRKDGTYGPFPFNPQIATAQSNPQPSTSILDSLRPNVETAANSGPANALYTMTAPPYRPVYAGSIQVDDGGRDEDYGDNPPREPKDPTYTDMNSPGVRAIEGFSYLAPGPLGIPAAVALGGMRYNNTLVNDDIRSSVGIPTLTPGQRTVATLGFNDYGGGYIGPANIGGNAYHVARGGGRFNHDWNPFNDRVTTLTPSEAQRRNALHAIRNPAPHTDNNDRDDGGFGSSVNDDSGTGFGGWDDYSDDWGF